MKNARLLWSIIRRCHFEKVLIGFVISYFLAALILQIVEPGINSYGDALWFTFVSCTTIGYGDMTAVTVLGRILTIYIVVYEILLVALLSGVIVSHYLEVIHRREEYTATMLMDKLTHLTELTPQELQEMQDKAREFDRKGRV